MLLFRWQDLLALGAEVFARLGAARDEAEWVASLLVRANLRGHESHGVLRIPEYYGYCRRGLLRPGARPRLLEASGPNTLVLDGQDGFGQVAAREAVRLAADRARAHGLAAVAVRRCNHVGRLADYAEEAAEAGLIGLVFANDSGAEQHVAPHGGVEARLSTNPLAVGLPRAAPPHLVVDLSTSTVASGKLKAALAAGRSVPEGWVQDSEGNPSTDPAAPFRVPEGTILPLAGHKGYALAIVVEVLAGILTGAGSVSESPGPEYQGLLVVALDVRRFAPLESFAADVERMLAYLKSARTAPGVAEILAPGERGWRLAGERRETGVPVPESTWREIQAVCADLGVAPPEPIGTA